MAAPRIAAVLLAVLCAELSAQSAPQGSLTIQVSDRTGAVIPGARIEIDPSFSKPGILFSTNSQGQSTLDLSEGSHVLSVTAQGFKKWMRSINVQSGSSRMVLAKLEVGEVISPTVADNHPLDIPLGQPEPAFLPLQPLLNLDPLSLKGAKRPW
jgi:hypothetical protein